MLDEALSAIRHPRLRQVRKPQDSYAKGAVQRHVSLPALPSQSHRCHAVDDRHDDVRRQVVEPHRVSMEPGWHIVDEREFRAFIQLLCRRRHPSDLRACFYGLLASRWRLPWRLAFTRSSVGIPRDERSSRRLVASLSGWQPLDSRRASLPYECCLCGNGLGMRRRRDRSCFFHAYPPMSAPTARLANSS